MKGGPSGRDCAIQCIARFNAAHNGADKGPPVTVGKIAGSWVDWDKYGLFQALGLVD